MGKLPALTIRRPEFAYERDPRKFPAARHLTRPFCRRFGDEGHPNVVL